MQPTVPPVNEVNSQMRTHTQFIQPYKVTFEKHLHTAQCCPFLSSPLLSFSSPLLLFSSSLLSSPFTLLSLSSPHPIPPHTYSYAPHSLGKKTDANGALADDIHDETCIRAEDHSNHPLLRLRSARPKDAGACADLRCRRRQVN